MTGREHAGRDEVGLVTGSSRGIGRAVALTLARRGCQVVINYKQDAEAAAKTLAEVEAAGGRGSLCRADVEDPDELAELFETVRRRHGHLDHLVANAAAGPAKSVEQVELRHLARSHAMNSQSFVLAAQHAVRLMGNGGRIVAVSSLAAGRAVPGYAAIGAQKAALESWVRYFAAELAPRGINVNTVTGGMVTTDSLEHYLRATGLTHADVVSHIPQGRPGSPQEIADAVDFLLSPAAAYITGQNLVVDGGLSITAPFCAHPG
ncbi:enoyl-[acyl-carrier protein] reductase III [Streptomyces sp. yr375]|uniref:SDR family oxidoreductase n=1 Tax=Streptomyces sp. yr375 TaxID=1761906 RepID=UPI0008CBB526|nr:SDR family oxidoreductase [Streptomyces sp. yr375]SEQ48145.1 enoyl-[acyl-carrier protein] reductase III [Streptomyces sp. yr375]